MVPKPLLFFYLFLFYRLGWNYYAKDLKRISKVYVIL